MRDHSGKRFPPVTPETRYYWQGCSEHQLRIQQCEDCAHFQFYPRIVCSACLGQNVEWVHAHGSGEVISYTIINRAVSEAYADDVPYVVALVRLREGPTMMTNIVECEPGAVHIGMAVTVLFEDWSDEISVPKFKPLVRGS